MAEWFLPLFPLKLVLFPRADLALHIFEERYKEMIGECLEHGWEFGVVLVEKDSIAPIGCTASITRVVKTYDDGRMDILVRGQRRFEIVHLDQEKSYLRCEAQFFDDEADDAAPEAARRQAVDLYSQIMEKLSAEEDSGEEGLEMGDPQLSFQIAGRLPPDLSFRQSLLPLRSESERLNRLISYMPQLQMRLGRLAQYRAKAGGNGRVR